MSEWRQFQREVAKAQAQAFRESRAAIQSKHGSKGKQRAPKKRRASPNPQGSGSPEAAVASVTMEPEHVAKRQRIEKDGNNKPDEVNVHASQDQSEPENGEAGVSDDRTRVWVMMDRCNLGGDRGKERSYYYDNETHETRWSLEDTEPVYTRRIELSWPSNVFSIDLGAGQFQRCELVAQRVYSQEMIRNWLTAMMVSAIKNEVSGGKPSSRDSNWTEIILDVPPFLVSALKEVGAAKRWPLGHHSTNCPSSAAFAEFFDPDAFPFTQTIVIGSQARFDKKIFVGLTPSQDIKLNAQEIQRDRRKAIRFRMGWEAWTDSNLQSDVQKIQDLEQKWKERTWPESVKFPLIREASLAPNQGDSVALEQSDREIERLSRELERQKAVLHDLKALTDALSTTLSPY